MLHILRKYVFTKINVEIIYFQADKEENNEGKSDIEKACDNYLKALKKNESNVRLSKRGQIDIGVSTRLIVYIMKHSNM